MTKQTSKFRIIEAQKVTFAFNINNILTGYKNQTFGLLVCELFLIYLIICLFAIKSKALIRLRLYTN